MDSGGPSDAQWTALFDFIEHDHEMLTGQLLHPAAKANQIKKWSSLAIIVNSVQGATAIKDGKQWRSAWNGMKSRARAVFRNHVRPTIVAGLPLPDLELVPFTNIHHRRVIRMTGVQAALRGLRVDEILNNEPDEPAAVGVAGANVGANVPIPNADDLLDMFGLEAPAVGNPQFQFVGNFDQGAQLPVVKAAPSVHDVKLVPTVAELLIPQMSDKRPVKDEPLEIVYETGPVKEEPLEIVYEKGPLKEEPLEIETITLSDTPVKQSHTENPRGGSGRPVCLAKRRLAMHSDSANIDVSHSADLQAAIHENGELVTQVLQLLHSFEL